MGGFGGSLKQLSIGFARGGKTNIHTGGATNDTNIIWSKTASQKDFTTSMADVASTIVDYFKDKGRIAYINVLVNISKSRDCAGDRAPTLKIRDIGILASIDPVAIDKACYDLIEKENNEGSKDWIKQAEIKLGLNTLNVAVEHKLGVLDYNLINIDNNESNKSAQELQLGSKNGKIPKSDESNLIPIIFIIILVVKIFIIIYNVLKKRKKGII